MLCYSGGMKEKVMKSIEIGEAIKKRRKELGFSQEQLADKVGVSYQQLQRYENGNSMINVEIVQRIATALGMSITAVFEADYSQGGAESAAAVISAEEKTLLRYFRDLSSNGDKKLALSVIRRFVKG